MHTLSLIHISMVTVFDTAFHQTMPEKAYLYGLPYEYYEKYGVRRYGFHGTSHSFVSKHAAKFLGMDINNSKIIVEMCIRERMWRRQRLIRE